MQVLGPMPHSRSIGGAFPVSGDVLARQSLLKHSRHFGTPVAVIGISLSVVAMHILRQ